MLVIASPRVGDFQEFTVAADVVAGQGDDHAVRRIVGAKSAPLPGETPIAPRRTLREVRFLLAKIVEGKVRMQSIAQKGFCRGLRLGAFEAGDRRRLPDFTLASQATPTRNVKHIVLFFFPGAEKPRPPIPEISFASPSLVFV